MQKQIGARHLNDNAISDRLYRQAFGSTEYLMIFRRPDLCFVAGRLLHYIENPTRTWWTYINAVPRLKEETLKRRIICNSQKAKHLGPVGFCASDWVYCNLYRKFTSGLVLLVAVELFLESLKSNL